MKIIVIDDDPTGSQTVHSCPLLLQWDNETLAKSFKENSELIFILANTRSLPPELAEQKIIEICNSIKDFLLNQKISLNDFFLVSRGDSTLRGHGVLEPNTLEKEMGPFDATFHIPAFFEGGRTTKDGIHFLHGFPINETDFAKDRIFGFSSAHLADWLEEKSNKKIKSSDVFHLQLKYLNKALCSYNGFIDLVDLLLSLNRNRLVIVDSESYRHLDIFVKAIKHIGKEKRFLFRSAASFISSLSEIYSSKDMHLDILNLRIKDINYQSKPGLIFVGSHVKTSDDQLAYLLEDQRCEALEIDVRMLSSIYQNISFTDSLIKIKNSLLRKILRIINSNKTPVLYTSRGEVMFDSEAQRMLFGIYLAEFMADLAGKISSEIRYIVSKGGITTQILLEKGLGLKKVTLHGQILPGLSIVSGINDVDFSQLPVITFPGNLGDRKMLWEVWQMLEIKQDR